MSNYDDLLKALKKRGLTVEEAKEKSSGKNVNIDNLGIPRELVTALQKRGLTVEDAMQKKYDAPVVRTRSTNKGNRIAEDGNDSLLDFFQKGALDNIDFGKRFEDGYQLFDVLKTAGDVRQNVGKAILGTAGDAGLNLFKGVAGLGEGIFDLAGYGVAGVADLFGKDEWADNLRDRLKVNAIEEQTEGAQEFLDKYSVLGRTSDAVMQGIGQMGAIMATGGVAGASVLGSTGATILTTGTMGLSGMGSGMSEAYQNNATDEEALTYGLIAGAADVFSELIFGGMGKMVNAKGLSSGITSWDDIIAKKVSNLFSNQIAKNFAEFGIKASAEGLEEFLAGTAQAWGKWQTYHSEEEFLDILKDENLLEQFVVGMATSGMMQSGIIPGTQSGSLKEANATGRDFITGFTQNEQAVIKKETEKRIEAEEAGGKKLTNKEKADIEARVEKEMEKGYISTDTIEEALGGETYKAYRDAIASEDAKVKEVEAQIKELENAPNTVGNAKKFDALQSQLEELKKKPQQNQLKTKLDEEIKGLIQNDRLRESYNEIERHKQRMAIDLNQYKNPYARKTAENLAKVLDNSNKAHDVLGLMTKMSEDLGVIFTDEDAQNFEGTTVAIKRVKEFAADGEATQYDIGSTNLSTEFKPVVTVDGKVVDNFSVDYKTGKITFDAAPTGNVSVEFRKNAKVNGTVSGNAITINMRSKKYLESIVGHEVTHKLENTEFYGKLQEYVFEYAKKKGEYDTRYKEFADLYNGIEGTTVEAELTAELIGDYLFQDSDFINKLSTENRNVFQKLYDEIKHLLTLATAGSEQARRLEQVKYKFEQAYREAGKAQKNTADGGAKYKLSDIDIDRVNIDFLDTKTANAAVDAKVSDLVERGKVVPLSDESISNYENRTDWENKKLVRKLLEDVLKPNMGVSVEFKYGEQGAIAYLTSTGINHSVGGPASPKKAAAFEKFRALVKNAEYVYSSENHSHNDTNQKIDGEKMWDTFVAVGTVNGEPYPVTFKIRSIDADVRSQIYEMATKNETGFSHGDGNQENLTDEHPNYGTSPISSDMVAQKEENVNGQFSLSDSEGRELSSEQAEYFKDSKVVDENGNLKVMYHGTPNGDFTVFKDGTYFTDNKAYADRYQNPGASSISTGKTASNPKTFEVYLNIKKPFDLSDPEARRIYVEDYIKGGNAMGINPYLSDAEYAKIESIDWTEGEDLREFLIDNEYDYDGLVLDEGAEGGYDDAVQSRGKSYVVFSPEQVKNVDNQKPTIDPDVRFSLSEAVEEAPVKSYAEITEAQQVLYQRENDLRKRKEEAVKNPELQQAMDEYADLFTEMRGLLAKRHQGTATQAELARIEEIKILREERMKRVTDLQESLGLNAISKEEAEIRETKEALRKAADEAWAREGAEKENKAIEKAGVPAAEYFRKKALKAFKTTTNFNEAGYMLPDGKLLNFSGGERNHRYRDHREIGEIYEATNGTAALNRFLSDGNIRIMAESPGIDLAAGVEPTKEQYAALRRFVNSNGVVEGQFFIDFSGVNGERSGKYEYTGKIVADRIINDIKYFYENGKVRESSGLLDFLSISADTETPKKYGDRATLGEEVLYKSTEDIAPVAETAAEATPTATQVNTQVNAEDLFPDDTAPIQKEYEFLLAEREDIKGAMDAFAAVGNYTGAEQLMADFEAVQTKIAEIEADEADRLASIEDTDAPPELAENNPEDVADNVPLTKTLVTELAKTIRAQLGLPAKRVAEVRDLIARYSNEEFPSKAHLYTEIAEKFGTYTHTEVDEELKDIKSLLRTYGIRVDDITKRDIKDYGHLMRRNFGKVRFSKEGLPVDVAYREFQEALPGYFPESIDVPTDQLMRIIEVANMDTTIEQTQEIDWQTLEAVTDTIMNTVGEFKQNRKESLANAHGRESFQSLMEDADRYVPPIAPWNRPPTRAEMNASPDDIAPTFDTGSGQQAMWENGQSDDIAKRLDRNKTALREEYLRQKAELEASTKDKGAFISNRASELYRELRDLRKGVKASDSLGYLLDHGYEWSAVRAALVNIQHTPDRTVNVNSAIENIAREMLDSEYQDRLYDISDLEAEYNKNVAKLESDAEKERAGGKTITRKVLHENIMDDIKTTFREKGFEFDDVLKNAKDLSTFATVDNTPQRVIEKALGYKEGQVLSDLTVNKVAQNETDGIRWLNSFTDKKTGLISKISKQYNIKPGSKASKAAQIYAEGFYVGENDAIIEYGDRELAMDFPDAKVQENIKKLAKDPRIRQIYDETLAAINASRARNAYPEIPRLDNYFLHFRAMEDTFSKLGLPFNPNDIRAKDLPTDLNGVTADLKPGQPYFASAKHRTGKRTSFDLLGGLEKYLTSAKNQIYHIDDIQTLRALRDYIAGTYGQATGLQDLDLLSNEEAEQRIEQVYNSHLSTFAKFLNEEANVLAGKTSLIDRGLEGVIGRRGITFLDTLNRQVGANMVGFNVSSALTNFLAPVQAFAKSNKFDFVKAMAQTASNKIGSVFGNGDSFADESPVMIRRKGAERFYRTPYEKVADTGYVLMGMVDNLSTELIARTKYNELTRNGMNSQQAHIETDKWVSRLMGDRSIGQQPQLYNSKMLGIITKFQLEVRNQLDSQFYDTIQEAKVSTEQIENKLQRNAKKAAKITSTFVQLAVMQHLFGKAFESVAGYNPAFDIIEALVKAFGWDDEEDEEDTVLDNLEEGFLSLLGDLPYTSTLTGGRIPIESALPITELIKGKDQYGNEKSRWDTIKEAAPYYLLPGGYGQIKKTKQGLAMFDEDLPIAGSYTDSGNLRFPVEDTLKNRVQAGIFGQWASANARDYFDNERKPLKEKQIQELIDVDLPIREYWDYREELSKYDTVKDKIQFIESLDLPISKKNILVNNAADRKTPIDLTNYGQYSGYEEFDFASKNPEKYSFLKENNVSYTDYTRDEDAKEFYDGVYSWASTYPEKVTVSKAVTNSVVEYRQYATALDSIRADKDSSGKTISGSAKAKKVAYINGLNIDYGAKLILFKSEYNADDTYNYEIVEYLNGRDDISYDEMNTILRELGFNVTPDGYITW